MDDPVWDASTFSKNRDRLLKKKVAKRFFQEVLKQARERNLLSDEHFTVDGTLIEAWASLKSFQRKEQEKQENGDEEKDRGKANVNFCGEKRSNQTHESKTDPDVKLARKGDGKEAKLSYNGNLLAEGRNGLIVDATVLEATGTAERDAALAMMEKIPGQQRVTVAGDKGHDTRDFAAECRNLQVTPHVAQNEGGG